jgi:hypothetical protein
VAFTRNPFDTSVSPATYTAEGPSFLSLVEQPKDIFIDGSEGDDTISADGSALETSTLSNYDVRGFEGDDTLTFNARFILDSVINGNEGDDTMVVGDLVANPTVNFAGSYFLGGKGDDTLTADDLSNGEVNGNIGDDTININNLFADDSSGQYVGGGQGNDIINISGAFNDSIVDGNKGIDTINVGAGDHSGTSINGGEGDDILRNRDGFTTEGLMMNGDAGNDTIISIGTAGSTVTGGEGEDTIVAVAGVGEDSEIDAGVGADSVNIFGSFGDEVVIFENGDSVVATASSLGNTPFIPIAGTITFGDGVDVITGFQTGVDSVDVDITVPVAFTQALAVANTDSLAVNSITEVAGVFDEATGVFSTANIAAGGAATDFLYVIGGQNITIGQIFTNSDDQFVSVGAQLAIGDFA